MGFFSTFSARKRRLAISQCRFFTPIRNSDNIHFDCSVEAARALAGMLNAREWLKRVQIWWNLSSSLRKGEKCNSFVKLCVASAPRVSFKTLKCHKIVRCTYFPTGTLSFSFMGLTNSLLSTWRHKPMNIVMDNLCKWTLNASMTIWGGERDFLFRWKHFALETIISFNQKTFH